MVNPEAMQHAQQAGVLREQNKLPEALAAYQRVLTLQPDFALAHAAIAEIFEGLGNHADAILHYEQALQLQPDLIFALNNLGVLYHAQGRLDDAIVCYERLLAQTPDDAKMRHNLGDAWLDKADFSRAENYYCEALTRNPDLHFTRYSQATLQLLQSDFAAGWQNYDARFAAGIVALPPQYAALPLWHGENRDGKILLWGEQGMGDEIMFAGLIPDALQTGNAFILKCANARLQPLFARSFPNVQVIADENPSNITAHLPTGSLPKLFRNAEKDFAKTAWPYLVADEKMTAEFRARDGHDKKRIGIAWHTRGPKTGALRSIALTQLAPLFAAAPQAHWVSLQYGDADVLATEATEANAPLTIDRSVDQLKDMDRFAAQIAALDLVITIDNATAHLAGALGIPTYLLVPFVPDWRWQLARADSPWYPKTKLFRQTQAGDWASVIQQVIKEILVHPAG